MSVRDRAADRGFTSTGHATGGDPVWRIRIQFTPALVVVRLAGAINQRSVQRLTDAFDSIAATSCPADLVVLDLSGVTRCDIAGLRGIETAAAALAEARKELSLSRAPQSVVRLIGLTGVAGGFTH